MKHSQWQPGGGYKYYESAGQHPIGDDLPDIRRVHLDNPIGIPSYDVGQPLPRGARQVGSGKTPNGVMAPTAAKGPGLSGTFSYKNKDQMVVFLAIVGIFLGAGIAGMSDDRKKRRAR